MATDASTIKKEKLVEALCAKLNLEYSSVISEGIDLDDYLDDPQYDLYLSLVTNLKILDGIDRSNGNDYAYTRNDLFLNISLDHPVAIDEVLGRYTQSNGQVSFCDITDGGFSDSNYVSEYSDGDDV